ncbi:MAG TPA: hypothetical protein VHM90_14885 [Phycisphaerae bacterium]|nr:hypothetical protein [Phycisphaerae bacterium]
MRKALRLDPIGVITVRGARNEHWEEVPLYQIRLRVAGADWIESLAVEAEKSYATIGRDVLEHFLLTAHGPEQWFELSLPAKP